jgi:hypothetical protein
LSRKFGKKSSLSGAAMDSYYYLEIAPILSVWGYQCVGFLSHSSPNIQELCDTCEKPDESSGSLDIRQS